MRLQYPGAPMQNAWPSAPFSMNTATRAFYPKFFLNANGSATQEETIEAGREFVQMFMFTLDAAYVTTLGHNFGGIASSTFTMIT